MNRSFSLVLGLFMIGAAASASMGACGSSSSSGGGGSTGAAGGGTGGTGPGSGGSTASNSGGSTASNTGGSTQTGTGGSGGGAACDQTDCQNCAFCACSNEVNACLGDQATDPSCASCSEFALGTSGGKPVCAGKNTDDLMALAACTCDPTTCGTPCASSCNQGAGGGGQGGGGTGGGTGGTATP